MKPNEEQDVMPAGMDESTLADLRAARIEAPEGFARGVMQHLAAPQSQPARRWWPQGNWWLPALAGAAAAVAVMAGLRWTPAPAATPGQEQMASRMVVRFELRAPGASSVEVLGSFNDWQPGALVLKGPDAQGLWTAEVALPSGRHEYQFLVDGREWVSDQKAKVLRPDGFGHMNAVVEI